MLAITKSPCMWIGQQEEPQYASRTLERRRGDTLYRDATEMQPHMVGALHLSTLHCQVTQSAYLFVDQQKIYACQAIATHITITIAREQIEQGVTQLLLRTADEQVNSFTADKISHLAGQIIKMRLY